MERRFFLHTPSFLLHSSSFFSFFHPHLSPLPSRARRLFLHSPSFLLHSSSFLSFFHPHLYPLPSRERRLFFSFEGERWRGIFPPLMGGIKGGCFPFFILHSSSFPLRFLIPLFLGIYFTIFVLIFK